MSGLNIVFIGALIAVNLLLLAALVGTVLVALQLYAESKERDK